MLLAGLLGVLGGGQSDPAILLKEGCDLDEVVEGLVIPHPAVALEEHHRGGLLGGVVLGELSVADLAGGDFDIERTTEGLALGLILGRVHPDRNLGHRIHGCDGGVVRLIERRAEDAEGQAGGLLEDGLRVLEVLGLGGDVGPAELPLLLTCGVGPTAVIPAVVPELDHAAVLGRVGLDPCDVVGVGLVEGIADDAHRHDGLLGFGPFGQALEALGQAFLFAGTDVIHLPDDDFILGGGEDVHREYAK